MSAIVVTTPVIDQSTNVQEQTTPSAHGTPFSVDTASQDHQELGTKWITFHRINTADFVQDLFELRVEDRRGITAIQIEEPDRDAIGDLGRDFWGLKLPSLRTIKLQHVAIDATILTRFLQNHRKTLRRVIIKNVALPRFGPDRLHACLAWIKVLGALRNCNKLTRLEISKIGWDSQLSLMEGPAEATEFAREYLQLPQSKYAKKCADRLNNRHSFYQLSKHGLKAKTVVDDAIKAFIGKLRETVPKDFSPPCTSRPYAR